MPLLPRVQSLFERLFYQVRYYANFLFFHGRTQARVETLVEEQHGNLPAGLQERAITEAIQGREQVQRQLSANARGWQRVPRRRLIGGEDSPKNWLLPDMWRYVLTLEIIGPEGQDSAYRNVVINAPDRLRREELEQRALDMYNSNIDHYRTAYEDTDPRKAPWARPDYARISDVRMVERDP